MNPIANVLEQFGIDAAALPHGNGHINNTFLVDSKPRVILQRINTNVFKNPFKLSANKDEPAKLMTTIIKYTNKNNSKVLNVIFSPCFVRSFTTVKNIVTRAIKPI